MMREEFSRASRPSREFLRLCQLVELLKKSGASEQAIDAMLREKIAADLDEEKSRRQQPSEN